MKDWKDYATKVNGLTTTRPLRHIQNSSQNETPSSSKPTRQAKQVHKPFPQVWLYINIGLVILFGLTLIYTLWSTIASAIKASPPTNNHFSSKLLKNTGLSYFILSLALLWIYSISAYKSGYQRANLGMIAITLVVSAILGCTLIINAFAAFIAQRHYKSDPSSYRIARKNFIFALIPPILVLITLISLFFIL